MNSMRILYHLARADFLERTRRTSFLVTICLIIYLGYAVNSGQILIKLDTYRGIYNSAWVGSLMSLVITFFLGLIGFYLVKNSVVRDEQTGVGQIIATTSLSRFQYLLGKWLSNFMVLGSLVALLMLAAILMQFIQRESAQIQIAALIAPFLFIALPMMALVAAIAVFFETLPWLKGGFGNLAYFGVFITLFMGGVYLSQASWLDVTGVSLVGPAMKMAAKDAFPAYNGSFVLAMISDHALQTFVFPGVDWTAGLILQRCMWLLVSIGLILVASLIFNRFDPRLRSISRRKQKPVSSVSVEEEKGLPAQAPRQSHLTPLVKTNRFRFNFIQLVWLESRLLVKGMKWYWFAGMAVLWVGCASAPNEGLRKYWFMMAVIWPVLVWSQMGEREIRYHVEQLVYQSAYPLFRLLFSSWLAGILLTAIALSGLLLGRLISSEPLDLLSWILSVVFIPTLALMLGIWSRSGKLFEVVYPILWYLGPFNRENGLAVIDYLGLHAQSPILTYPLLFAGFLLIMVLVALIGRRRQLFV
jgi:hypothetical protein